MKARVLAVVSLLALLARVATTAEATAKTTLAITGMTCGGCTVAVKVQLRKTEGVTAYDVSLERGEAEVTFDPDKTTPEKIAASVSKTGFAASVRKAGDKAGERGGGASAVAAKEEYTGASCQRDCCQRPYLIGRNHSQPEWDIHLVFEPGIEWSDRAPVPSRWLRQTALLPTDRGGEPTSVLWANDYASAPVEGRLTEHLRRLMRAESRNVAR